MIEKLFKASDGFQVELDDHTGGHLRAVITRGAEKFEVEGCYGQNSSFAQGKKVSFVSYTVRAESAFGRTDGGTGASESAELIGKIAGVVIGVALACVLMSPILKSAKFIYCLPVLAAAAYLGRLFGLKAARTLAGATQSSPENEGSSSNYKGEATAIWKRLTHAIETVTSEYPTA